MVLNYQQKRSSDFNLNIFVLNAITDITKLELVDTVVVSCCCQ